MLECGVRIFRAKPFEYSERKMVTIKLTSKTWIKWTKMPYISMRIFLRLLTLSMCVAFIMNCGYDFYVYALRECVVVTLCYVPFWNHLGLLLQWRWRLTWLMVYYHLHIITKTIFSRFRPSRILSEYFPPTHAFECLRHLELTTAFRLIFAIPNNTVTWENSHCDNKTF